jgi:hypothetical protein
MTVVAPSLEPMVGSTVTIRARTSNVFYAMLYDVAVFDNDGLVMWLLHHTGSIESSLSGTSLAVKPGAGVCKQSCGLRRQLVFTAQTEVALEPGASGTLSIDDKPYLIHSLGASERLPEDTCSDGFSQARWLVTRAGL